MLYPIKYLRVLRSLSSPGTSAGTGRLQEIIDISPAAVLADLRALIAARLHILAPNQSIMRQASAPKCS